MTVRRSHSGGMQPWWTRNLKKDKNEMSPLSSLRSEVSPDLLRCAPTGGVGDGPGRLLPRLELRLGLNLNEDRENVGVYHGLDLLSVASCDV